MPHPFDLAMAAEQIAVRLPGELLAFQDDLVGRGVYESRAAAVRTRVEAILGLDRRCLIDQAVVGSYQRIPPREAERQAAISSLRDAIVTRTIRSIPTELLLDPTTECRRNVRRASTTCGSFPTSHLVGLVCRLDLTRMMAACRAIRRMAPPAGSSRLRESLAVDHLSFSVEDGETFGVLGPNGAEKSTTVECIEGGLELR